MALQDMSLEELKALRAQKAQQPQQQAQQREEPSAGRQTLNAVGAAGLGGINELANTGASIGNLALSPFTDKRIPYAHLEKYIAPESSSEYAFQGGELAANLIPFARALKFLGKVARPAGKLGLASDVGTGAALGYAGGERENEHGEKSGRELGAVLGGTGGALFRSRSPAIAERIVEGKKSAQEKLGKAYDRLFSDVKKAGANDISRPPKLDLEKYEKQIGKDHLKSYEKFKKNPTVENAHKAQSDLKAWQRQYRPDEVRALAGDSKDAYDAVKQAQKKLNGASYQSVLKSGNPELAKKYTDLTERYKKEVVPYFSRDLDKYANKKLKPENLVEKLRNDDEFMIALGKKYPELKLNKVTSFDSPAVQGLLKESAKYGAIGAGGTAAYGAYKSLKE